MEKNSNTMAAGNPLEQAAGTYFLNPTEDHLAQLVAAAESLIHYFINLHGLSLSRQDLYQAGVEGMMKAVKRFDASRGNTFTTYAGSLIAGEIRHYVRKENAYRQYRTVEKLQDEMDEAVIEYLAETGEAPSIDELSERTKIRADGVREIFRSNLVSLDELDMSKIASTAYETFKLPVEDKLLLEQAMAKLTALQRKVVHLLFYRGLTQEQTAERLGINQRKVSRVLKKSLDELQQNMK